MEDQIQIFITFESPGSQVFSVRLKTPDGLTNEDERKIAAIMDRILDAI